MKPMSSGSRPLHAAVFLLGALLLGACHQSAPTPPPAASGAATSETAAAELAEGVALKPEEIEKMGIETTVAEATTHTPENLGFGLVMAREAIAQAVAELVTAEAVERQSHAALERVQRLDGTPGALSADAKETAARQAAVDQAALALAKQRLSASFGENAPWKKGDRNALLGALADGEVKLVRATFALGALSSGAPSRLRLAHINASVSDKSWTASTLWDAPADSSVPGRSFFALLKGSDAHEGERLLVWAPVGSPKSGVVIPSAAVVISEGKYWCYVEKKPGSYSRVEFDTSMPVADGFFVSDRVVAGDKVVTASAGQLLARETNPGAAAD
jgi:hypothetical protein